jgi:serine/threonine-protein kinase
MIDHPNVVRIHEVGEDDDGTPYIVMEFLSGETLGERLTRDGRLDLAQGVAILEQAASALWAAHQKGIVHRDVKPDNLFLLGHSSTATETRVLDFGLSRLFQSRLTSAGTVIGTPGYMAPEQVVAASVDQRSDVYGLGMVMYRSFVGRLPFDGPNDVIILAKQLLCPLPSQYPRDLDPRVVLVIETALKKNPENRYPSMRMFREDLLKLVRPGPPLFATESERDHYPLEGTVEQVAAGYRQVLQKLEKAGPEHGSPS